MPLFRYNRLLRDNLTTGDDPLTCDKFLLLAKIIVMMMILGLWPEIYDFSMIRRTLLLRQKALEHLKLRIVTIIS